MTEKMRTVCVGRYLVDVPVQAEVSMSHERIDGFAMSGPHLTCDVHHPLLHCSRGDGNGDFRFGTQRRAPAPSTPFRRS